MRWLRGVVTALLVGSLAGAIVLHRTELADAIRHMRVLSGAWVLSLGGVFAIGMMTQGLMLQAITPGMTLLQSWMTQEAATAATNSVVGSGPVSTGLRMTMMRSWQVSDRSIGISIVTQNVLAAFAVWTVALGTALAGLHGAMRGSVDRRVLVLIVTVASIMLVGSLLFWAVVLFHPGPTAWLAARLSPIVDRAKRRWPRLPALDLVALAEQGRTDARHLLRHRGRRIGLVLIADQILILAKPVIVVRAFGISSSVLPSLAIVVAAGRVRLASALSPLPGGVGVTEIGLATLLTRFGGPESTVLAAVLSYRVLTFILPMFSGLTCLAYWRWQHPNRRVIERPADLSQAIS